LRKSYYFEILSFSYLFNPTETQAALNPSFLTGYQFGLFMNIGAILQKPSLIKQAKSGLKVAHYEHDAYDLNLEAEVKRRYYTYVRQKVLFRLKSEALLDIESMLKEVRYKYENGTDILENYNKILIMYYDNTAGKLAVESEVYIAQSNLEEILGQKLSTIE
jgi:outer membrane protein TolC